MENKFQGLFNFHDIGKKIKNLTKWSCWVLIVLCWIGAVIAFFVAAAEDEAGIGFGYLLLFGGVTPFLIWIGSWMTYGFGELIDKVSQIEENTREDK